MIAEIKGIKSYYEIRGNKGTPVVLLHGWGCSSEHMSGVAEALQEQHRVLLIDFPGFGKSGRPPEPWGVPEYAAWLKEILEKLSFPPCAVVAHSFGCRVSAWAAGEWPGLFRKIVFTGAAGIRKKPDEASKKRGESFQKKKNILKKMESIPPLRGLGERMEEKLRKKYGSADYNALDAEMRKTFVKIISLDLRDLYPKIQQPTLLVWGDADTETPLWMGQEMEKMIPDSGLVILEGGSHFAYLEQMQRFCIIVQHFLSEA